MRRALQASLDDYNSRARTQNGGASSTRVAERDLETLDQEIEDVQAQIHGLETLLQELSKQREEKLRQIRAARVTPKRGVPGPSKAGKIDYNSEFEWTGALHDKLQSVFGFDSFRLCQEG